MPRPPSRLLLPAVALVTLISLSPSLAAALPLGQPGLSADERAEGTPGLFAKLWELLSAVWANGSILDPNGTGSGASSGPGSVPAEASSGDNGSILDPNGRP